MDWDPNRNNATSGNNSPQAKDTNYRGVLNPSRKSLISALIGDGHNQNAFTSNAYMAGGGEAGEDTARRHEGLTHMNWAGLGSFYMAVALLPFGLVGILGGMVVGAVLATGVSVIIRSKESRNMTAKHNKRTIQLRDLVRWAEFIFSRSADKEDILVYVCTEFYVAMRIIGAFKSRHLGGCRKDEAAAHPPEEGAAATHEPEDDPPDPPTVLDILGSTLDFPGRVTDTNALVASETRSLRIFLTRDDVQDTLRTYMTNFLVNWRQATPREIALCYIVCSVTSAVFSMRDASKVPPLIKVLRDVLKHNTALATLFGRGDFSFLEKMEGVTKQSRRRKWVHSVVQASPDPRGLPHEPSTLDRPLSEGPGTEIRNVHDVVLSPLPSSENSNVSVLGQAESGDQQGPASPDFLTYFDSAVKEQIPVDTRDEEQLLEPTPSGPPEDEEQLVTALEEPTDVEDVGRAEQAKQAEQTQRMEIEGPEQILLPPGDETAATVQPSTELTDLSPKSRKSKKPKTEKSSSPVKTKRPKKEPAPKGLDAVHGEAVRTPVATPPPAVSTEEKVFFKSFADFLMFSLELKHKLPIGISEFLYLDDLEKKVPSSPTGPAWEVCFNKNDIEIYKSIVTIKTTGDQDTDMIMVKGYASLKGIPMDIVFENLINLKQRVSWDTTFYGMEIVQTGMPVDNDVIYSAIKAPWPVADRDFLQYRRCLRDPSSIKILHRSAEHPKKPVDKSGSVIRAESVISAYVIRPAIDNSSTIFLVAQTDIKGQVPRWLVNQVAQRAPAGWIDNLRAACYKYMKTKP